MPVHLQMIGSLSMNFSDCPNGSQWVWEIFHECAQDGWDISSVVLGLLSIFCFAAASFPQYYLACKTGIMDQALSVYFLLGWLGGDSLNLIGSFLADQLPLQVYTAIYYVLADLLMMSLYLYYKVKNQNRTCKFQLTNTGQGKQTLPSSLPGDDTASFRGRMLLSSAEDRPGWEPFTQQEIIGFIIGSVSSVLYLLSRVPQIYTNFKRKSTVGISYSLFALVMLGNTLYGLSVLLKNPDWGQAEGSYVIHHLPWLIGSLGVLALDIIVSCFCLPRHPHPQPEFTFFLRFCRGKIPCRDENSVDNAS
uniref:Lysosomal amino acid transporter 1 homolog n=1 Tax=Podarcis muralis TaxID=64176 RepID=A0A670J873_PODMU